ncbi:MAG: F0F1 ATP synthase subunit B [Anaerolineae bacterium]|nr:F0F1 ATP synthase subunit B [Anaerolineae bacterium]
MDALGKLGVNGVFLLSQIVNFLLLFLVLRFLLWKPLTQRLEARRRMLEQERADAEALAAARANIEAERQQVLGEACAQADRIVAEAREQARNYLEQAQQEARAAMERALEQAREAAEEERNRMLGELRGQIAALAIAAAQRIVGETLDERRQQALVEAFFSGVREGRVEVLPEGALAGMPASAAVTVTSAIPLTEAQQAAIRRDLSARLGRDVAPSFRVDPRILGGLVVRIGDRLVDGSVAGQLERLRQTLS